MGSVGVARKFDFVGLFRNFIRPDEIEDDKQIDEKMFVEIDSENINVTQEQIEELKKSQMRLRKFAEKYNVENFEVKKAPKAKKTRLESRKIDIQNDKIKSEKQEIKVQKELKNMEQEELGK